MGNANSEERDIIIHNSFCAWIDLLGYGQSFYNSGWDLTKEGAIDNLKRIKKLEQEIVQIQNPFSETLFMLNDGVIYNFDIPAINANLIMRWLIGIIQRFNDIDEWDKRNGYYGARGVLAYGQRAQYRKTDTLGRGDYIMTSEKKKESYNKKRIVYTPEELQMNTAFSKSFIIEESGSKYGVKKNKLNITEEVIEKVVESVNRIKTDKFGTIGEDPSEPYIMYVYDASFENNILSVKATYRDITWVCLEICFEDPIEYINNNQSLCLKLFTPKKITAALYGPSDVEEMFFI